MKLMSTIIMDAEIGRLVKPKIVVSCTMSFRKQKQQLFVSSFQTIYLDVNKNGLTFDTWGMGQFPVKNSLIMLILDFFLYAFLAFWLDNVIPSKYFFVIFVLSPESKYSKFPENRKHLFQIF